MSGEILMAAVVAVTAGVCAAAALTGSPPVAGPTGRRATGRPTWLAVVGRGGGRRRNERIAGLLLAANLDRAVAEVIGVRRGTVAACLIGAVVLPAVLPVFVIVATVISLRGPEIVLGRLAKRRTRAAGRELSLFLDLLAVATAAGLAPQLAVRRAIEPLEGPLGDELRGALDAVDLGRRWRDELADVSRRSRLPDLSRATALLVRTERLGSSLADEMARLAADVRETRRARATDRARAAPVKMLFPLVFLILPAFLLLTVAPVLLTTVKSIG